MSVYAKYRRFKNCQLYRLIRLCFCSFSSLRNVIFVFFPLCKILIGHFESHNEYSVLGKKK